MITKDIISTTNEALYSKTSAWHWFVIIGTVLGTLIDGLIPHSFGTFIASFRSSSNNNLTSSFSDASQFQLDWIPALSSAFPCLFLPLFTLILEKWKISYQLFSGLSFVIISLSCILSSLVTSWTLLIVTYSILYSIGSSLFLAITIILSAEYFPAKHQFYVLATSLYQIGYPTATLIGNASIAILIINYGWQNTFKYVAIVDICCGILISIFMKPLHNKTMINCCSNESIKSYGNNEDNSPTDHVPLKSILSRCEIWTWFIAKYINYMCWYGLRTNIVTYIVRSTEFGLTKSSILMSIYAGVEIIVALMASFSGDKFRRFLIHIHIIAAISLAIHTAIFPIVLTSYLSGIFLMIGVGISIQLSLSFGYPASVQVWDSNLNTKTGWVFTNIAAGLGVLSSPFISGIVMDQFGIKAMFYAQFFGWVIQAILFLSTLIIIKYKREYSDNKYEEIN